MSFLLTISHLYCSHVAVTHPRINDHLSRGCIALVQPPLIFQVVTELKLWSVLQQTSHPPQTYAAFLCPQCLFIVTLIFAPWLWSGLLAPLAAWGSAYSAGCVCHLPRIQTIPKLLLGRVGVLACHFPLPGFTHLCFLPQLFQFSLCIPDRGVSLGDLTGCFSDPPHAEPKRRQCKVLFEYQPVNEDELELKVGDIIDINEEVFKMLYSRWSS